jgi:hypothetical protein
VAFDNAHNGPDGGLSGWLLRYLKTLAQHDFLEFNARAYARLSLHALLNLHEFAREKRIRTAAQIVLDYTMMKFAVSSVRGRRISPFRRQHRINHQANIRNDLYAESGEQVAGFFLAYTGLTDAQDQPARFPDSLAFQAVIAATAAYRPPPAAYKLALDHQVLPATHRFHHGRRPRLLDLEGEGEDVDPGIEVYHRSPSFLLSAGGSFLNSGYGHDEIDVFVQAFEQTSRAQATTLIPTRGDTRSFHDLIRFEPYPDPAVDPYADDPDDPDTLHSRGVAMGVHRGIIAGANLRPAERKRVLEQSTSEAPALASHDGRLLVAWKGSGNDNVNVAKAQATTLLGIDGVEGVEEKAVLGETTDRSPTLASHNGRVFLAWRGSGNDQLNLAFSDDGGRTFKGTRTLSDSSDHAPALASHAGRLLLAWTGRGNDKLNVAKVVLFANTAGGFGIEGLEDKVVLDETSSDAPALASNQGRLFLAWKGSGNDNLNVAVSEDGGMSLRAKRTLPETSSHRPALASHTGRLFLGWKGSGNDQLNVAHVVLLGSTAGATGFELEGKVVLPETSGEPPALASNGELLLVAWKDEEDDNLGLRVSRDGTFRPPGVRISPDGTFRTPGPWIFCDLSRLGFYLAAYRAAVARPEDLDDPPDNLGIVYAREAKGMDFETFRRLTLERNRDLPAAIEFGSFHEFHPPDGGRFLVSFQLTDQPQQPRVVDLDDVIDFGTLPLVRGEYMEATDHVGRIEIRDPGCLSAPVVLDFRNAEAPERVDNLAACPQPWVDRAQALLDLAGRLSERGDHIGARLALVDRADVFAQLAAANPSFLPSLAQTLHILTQRHLADGHPDQARPVAREAIQAYRQLAATPGANSAGVASNLIVLSGELGAAHLDAESTAAAQAAADVR